MCYEHIPLRSLVTTKQEVLIYFVKSSPGQELLKIALQLMYKMSRSLFSLNTSVVKSQIQMIALPFWAVLFKRPPRGWPQGQNSPLIHKGGPYMPRVNRVAKPDYAAQSTSVLRMNRWPLSVALCAEHHPPTQTKKVRESY